MTNKDKSRVYDFIQGLGTLEFIYYVLMIEFFDYKPKPLQKKIERFLDEKRQTKNN